MSTHTISVCHCGEYSVYDITCVGEVLWYQVLNTENRALKLILKFFAFRKNDQFSVIVRIEKFTEKIVCLSLKKMCIRKC